MAGINFGPGPSGLSVSLTTEEEGKKMRLVFVSVNNTWANGETLQEPGHFRGPARSSCLKP